MGTYQQILDLYDQPDTAAVTSLSGQTLLPAIGSDASSVTGSGNIVNSAANGVGINTSNPGAGAGSSSFMSNYFSGNPLTNAANIIMHPLDFLSDAGSAASSSAGSALSSATGGGTSSSLTNTISALFLRGVVIITGFIFVAVGLSMFKQGDIISIAAAPGKALKKGIGA